ncbi:hypothetical protein FACS189434_12860 [Bacteroidia bacterium]|nr:hypothetical protein FACS189434_12860 [Bacteroidia bacterium]
MNKSLQIKRCVALALVSLFVSATSLLYAAVVLPGTPFGTTGVTCQSPCSTTLVGYVNFANKNGVETGRWSINDIETYGAAPIQSVSTTRTFTNGAIKNTGNYTIVKNPSSLGEALQNIPAGVPGGLFVVQNTNDVLQYTIRGLNSPADFGIMADNVVDTRLMYCVRIKVRNLGTAGACNSVGNNISINFRDPDGNDFSVGNLFYNGTNRGNNGRYNVTSCNGTSNGNAWGGNGQITNPVGYDGSYAILEGCFMVGAGRAANTQFRDDDGFQITINGPDTNGDNVFAIESIEVYGCLPKKITAKDEAGVIIANNTFCENGPATLTAEGGGFGGNIKWYKGATLADAIAAPPVGAGTVLHAKAPWGVGSHETYWAVGDIGTDSISITARFCCSSLGTASVVFEEHFPLYAPTTVCNGTATVSPLNPAHGTTTYNYTSNDGNVCTLTEDEYAIATHSYWGWWNNRTRVNEHTGTAGSGMMMVNAAANTNKYFYTLTLDGLCAETKYEFSAWYASIANAGSEQPSNITFQIFESTNMVTPIATGNTGDFGGTANAPHNSSFVWRRYDIVFNTPPTSNPSTQYILRLKNNRGDVMGNDLLIDDITVTKCVTTMYTYEEGTNNIEVEVCSPDTVRLEVPMQKSLMDVITGIDGGSPVYFQWMKATSPTGPWTLEGTVRTFVLGNGKNIWSVFPPDVGETVYYRAKISNDIARAMDINAPLNGTCFNDVITQVFRLERKGELDITVAPEAFPVYICHGELVGEVTLRGTAPVGSDGWGWIKHEFGLQTDTVGMVLSSDTADMHITITESGVGTYYFVVKKGMCRATKSKVVEVSDKPEMSPPNIVAPAPICEDDTLNLIAPAITSEAEITNQGWLLNNTVFHSGTPLTAADNGKMLKYFAVNICDSVFTNEVPITVYPKKFETQNVTICETEFPFAWRDTILTSGGTFIFNRQTILGCDSIVTLNLTANVLLTKTINASVCVNEAYDFYGTILNASGVYIDTIAGIPCDTIVTLNLTVIPLPTKMITESICATETYDFYGTTLNTSGIYIDTISGIPCDTIVTLNLTVIPLPTKAITESICATETYDFYGTILNAGGTYIDTISGIPCDTIVTLNLTVIPLPTKTITESICATESYDFYGSPLNASGIYIDTISGIPCDTIVTLNLTEIPLPTKMITESICATETYDFYGSLLNASGTYIDTISGLPCDTIVTLNLTVIPLPTKTITENICATETYDFYGTILNASDTYLDTVSGLPCDTIVTLNLTVIPLPTKTITESICATETYDFYGNLLNASGTYIDTISAGCFSAMFFAFQSMAGGKSDAVFVRVSKVLIGSNISIATVTTAAYFINWVKGVSRTACLGENGNSSKP